MSVNMGQATGYLDLDTSKFKSGFKSALSDLKSFQSESATTKDKIASFGSAATSAGKSLTKGLTVPIAGLGAAAVKVTADFDAGMSKVQAVSGATGEEIDQLRDKAKEMGAKTKFSATQSAEAFNYMAMAGWKTEDMLDGIDGVMNLAAASGEDLATTSDIVTDALTAFGLKAEDSAHFADVLAASSSNANTNVAMLGESFKYVAPIAGSLGYSAEDTSIALGLMANSGIKASQAGTTMRGALTRLAKPTGEVSKAMKQYGISMVDANGNMLPLRDLMGQLREKLGGLSKAEQAAAATTLFGKNAMSGMLAIVNASQKDYDKLTNAIDNADGTAEKMSKTMMDNLPGAITLAKSALEGLGIRIGEVVTPVVTKVVQAFTKFVSWLTNASDKTVAFAVALGAVLASIGPLLLITGTLARNILSLIELHEKLAKVMASETVKEFIKSAKAKITDMIATIQDTAANASFKTTVSGLGTAVSTAASRVLAFAAAHKIAAGAALGIVGVIASLAVYMIKTGTSVDEMRDKIVNTLKSFAQQIPQVVASVGATIQALVPQITNVFSSIIAQIPVIVGQIITTLQNLIPQIASVFSRLVSQLPIVISQAFTAMQTLIPQLLAWWANDMPLAIQAGADIIVSFLEGISQTLPIAIEQATNVITQIIEGFVAALPQFIDAGIVAITNMIQGITSTLPVLITSVVQALSSALPKIINTVTTAIPQLISSVVSALSSNIGPILQGILTIIQTVIQSLLQNLPLIINAVIQIITAIAQALIDNLPVIIDAAIKIIVALATGLIKALPQLVVAAVRIGVALIKAILTAIPAILKAGVKIIQSLWKSMSGKKGWLSGKIKSFVKAIPTAILTILKALWKAGVNLIKRLWEGMKNFFTGLPGKLKEKAKEIPKAIKNGIGSLFSIGSNVISGLWDGLKDKWKSVTGWLSNAGKKIKSFFTKPNKIKSPSRVFMDIGRYLMEGLYIGMNRSFTAVKSLATHQANELQDLFNVASKLDTNIDARYNIGTDSMIQDALNNLSDSMATNQQRPVEIVNNITVDGAESPESYAQRFARQLKLDIRTV